MASFNPKPGLLWIIQLAEQLNVLVSRRINAWPSLDKEALGDQLMRATDSIGLNMSEGYARTHTKERLRFFSYAQGSIEEALFAVRRARDRCLLTRLDAHTLSNLLIKLSVALKSFVESVTENDAI